jgi:uncharacterized protein (DUF305 family)
MSKRVRRALVAAVAVPVFALAACGSDQMGGMGYGAGGPSARPDTSPTGSVSTRVNPADLMFVMMMVPHHEQAVQMSDLLLAKSGVDADARRLAEQIKAAQQPEIDQMRGWLTDWGMDRPSMSGVDHSGHMDGMLSKEEIAALGAADGPTGQKLFLEGMIDHHQGAIEMANNVLGVGQDPEVKKLAETIVISQQAEITTMQQMLDR